MARVPKVWRSQCVVAPRSRSRSFAGRLDALSPLRVLARGYAVAFDERGHALRAAGEARPGDRSSQGDRPPQQDRGRGPQDRGGPRQGDNRGSVGAGAPAGLPGTVAGVEAGAGPPSAAIPAVAMIIKDKS